MKETQSQTKIIILRWIINLVCYIWSPLLHVCGLDVGFVVTASGKPVDRKRSKWDIICEQHGDYVTLCKQWVTHLQAFFNAVPSYVIQSSSVVDVSNT